jgi:hypothetical protein
LTGGLLSGRAFVLHSYTSGVIRSKLWSMLDLQMQQQIYYGKKNIWNTEFKNLSCTLVVHDISSYYCNYLCQVFSKSLINWAQNIPYNRPLLIFDL